MDIISFLSSIDAFIKLNPKSIPESTFDFPKSFNATSVVILLKDILTFAKFLNPSINTA